MATALDEHGVVPDHIPTVLTDLPFEILTQVIQYLPHSKWIDKLAQTYNRHVYGVCLPELLIRRRIPAGQRAIYDAFELSWYGLNPWNYDSGQLDHLATDCGERWPQIKRFDFNFLTILGKSDLEWLRQDVALWRSCSPSQSRSISSHTSSDFCALDDLVQQATAVKCVIPQSFLNYYRQLDALYDDSILEGHVHDPALGPRLVMVHPGPGETGYMFRFRVESGHPTYLYLQPNSQGHAVIQSWQKQDILADGWDLATSCAPEDTFPLDLPVQRGPVVTDLSRQRSIEVYLQSRRLPIPSGELVRATDFEEWLAGQHYFSLYGLSAGSRLRTRMLPDATVLAKRIRAFQRLLANR